MLTSICVNTFNRTDHLVKTLQAIAQYAKAPYEVIAVDDCSSNPEVVAILQHFQRQFEGMGVRFRVYVQEKNGGHAAANNKAWQMAAGDVIVHVEDDILLIQDNWTNLLSDFLTKHPEVGQVVPEGSGRGEWIIRRGPTGEYREFAWALGGFFAIRREVFEKVGGWDESLVHQVEPDYNLRVRMAGWRLAEVPGIHMIHLGEGENHDTFKRQAQIIVGLTNMLRKWNIRFVGHWDYSSVWSMSWDDFPPNANFRRQLAAWFASEALNVAEFVRQKFGVVIQTDTAVMDGWSEELKRLIALYKSYSACRLNSSPAPFKYPGHWGAFELITTIRPPGREREDELVGLMRSNFVFKDEYRLRKMVQECAERYGEKMNDEQLDAFLKGKEIDYSWQCDWKPR